MTFPSPLVLQVQTNQISANEHIGPKTMIKALWDGFSDFDWTIQKLIPEDDGGENYVVGRSEWTGSCLINPY